MVEVHFVRRTVGTFTVIKDQATVVVISQVSNPVSWRFLGHGQEYNVRGVSNDDHPTRRQQLDLLACQNRDHIEQNRKKLKNGSGENK